MEQTECLLQIIAFCVLFYVKFRIVLYLMKKTVKWFNDLPDDLQPSTALR